MNKQARMSVLFKTEFAGLPPSVNRLRKWSSLKAIKRWKMEMAGIFSAAWQGEGAYSGYVHLDVRFIAPSFDPWDVDNRLKVLQDALVMGGVLDDDHRIWDVQARREYGDGPVTVIALAPYAPLWHTAGSPRKLWGGRIGRRIKTALRDLCAAML